LASSHLVPTFWYELQMYFECLINYRNFYWGLSGHLYWSSWIMTGYSLWGISFSVCNLCSWHKKSFLEVPLDMLNSFSL
jgi:hypothetical protein